MGGWKTILLLKIFLFFYVHIRVCFAEQMSFSIINIHHFLFCQTHLTIRSVLFSYICPPSYVYLFHLFYTILTTPTGKPVGFLLSSFACNRTPFAGFGIQV